MVKLGSGTLTLSGANTYTGGTIVSNGVLLITGNTGPSAITVNSGATLGGTGSVGGAVTVNTGGALSPGTSAGTFTINNNLILNSGSLLNFELGTTSDKVVVTGNLTLVGILNVTNLAGFGTNTYTLISYNGSLSGTLPTIAAFPAGYVGTLNTNTPGQINLVVRPSPPPAPAFSGVSISEGSLILSATGQSNRIVYLLTSTNVALPRALWLPLATNQFDAAGKFSFTNPVNPDVLQQFYMLEIPSQ